MPYLRGVLSSRLPRRPSEFRQCAARSLRIGTGRRLACRSCAIDEVLC